MGLCLWWKGHHHNSRVFRWDCRSCWSRVCRDIGNQGYIGRLCGNPGYRLDFHRFHFCCRLHPKHKFFEERVCKPKMKKEHPMPTEQESLLSTRFFSRPYHHLLSFRAHGNVVLGGVPILHWDGLKLFYGQFSLILPSQLSSV